MNTITLKITKIHPYEKNPRINDNAVEAVKESIKQCGYISPIIVDENNVVLAGHTRLKAIKELGWKEVEVIRKDNLTEEQKRKYRILDNKTSEYAEWDYELLKGELEGLDFNGFDFEWGIVEDEPEVEEDDYDIDKKLEEIKEPQAKLGDVYQLGNHRLMCGDSTNPVDVDELMNGEYADLLLTDPPYNVDYEGSDGQKIENDKMEDASFRQFLVQAFQNADTALKNGGGFYIWHADSEGYNFRGACHDIGWKVRQCLIWVKNSFTFGRQDYKWQHEPCLYGWKEGSAHYFIEEYNHPTIIEQEINLDKLKKDDLKKILEDIMYSDTPSTIIRENKPLKNDLHPTMKPIKLLAYLLKNSSERGQKILDLFGGSGSTMIACEQLNRQCYMMEYDPKYVDVIINRWEEYTGKKATKINERRTK